MTARRSTAPGLVIAAPSSGSGKTLVTLGLMRAWRDRGLRVAAAKAGPDYIDPRFHEAACGGPHRAASGVSHQAASGGPHQAACGGGASINLDPWAMRPGLVAALAADHADGADLLVIEGVMGLFDGAEADTEGGAEGGAEGGLVSGVGSTADLAALLGLPVVLVLDVAAQAQTAAAVAAGLARARPDVTVAGVVLNRVGGPRHAELIRPALAAVGLPLLGWLPRIADLALPSRHLGLVQAAEHEDLDARVARAGRLIGDALDLDALLALARRPTAPLSEAGPAPSPPPGQRIALAADAAFAFVYPHLLHAWRRAGATIHPFSPLAGQPPDPEADAVFLPGGYPELFAGQLAAARGVWSDLRRLAERHVPIHGECGGFMALGQGLEDADGQRHEMAGLLPLETSMAQPRMTLGYRQAVLGAPAYGLAPGARLRGHEFHYARIAHAGPGDPLLRWCDAAGRDLGPAGLSAGSVTGAFFHLIDAHPP